MEVSTNKNEIKMMPKWKVESAQKAYDMKTARDEERLAYIRRMNPQPHTTETNKRKELADRLMLYNQLEPPALKQEAKSREASQATETNPHLLNFYLYLWGPSAFGPCCPGITIPDTIVIQDGVVDEWFFTASDGTVRRKSEEKKADKEAIYQTLVAGPASQMRRGTVALHIMPDTSAAGAAVTPLDADTLADWIGERTMRDGVLQKYTIGPGCEDVNITTLWSHGQTWIDRGVSPAYRPRNRSGAPAGEHGAGVGTLRPEATPLPSASTGKNKSLLMERMSQLCEVMALHITDTSPQRYRMERMKLHFRVDSGGGIKFVFCSEAALEEAPRDMARRLERQAAKREKRRIEAKVQAVQTFAAAMSPDPAKMEGAGAAGTDGADEAGAPDGAGTGAEGEADDVRAAAPREGGEAAAEGEPGGVDGGGKGGESEEAAAGAGAGAAMMTMGAPDDEQELEREREHKDDDEDEDEDGLSSAASFEVLPSGLPHLPKDLLANSLGLRRQSRATAPGVEVYNRARAGLHQAEVAMTSRTYGGPRAVLGVGESRRFVSSRETVATVGMLGDYTDGGGGRGGGGGRHEGGQGDGGGGGGGGEWNPGGSTLMRASSPWMSSPSGIGMRASSPKSFSAATAFGGGGGGGSGHGAHETFFPTRTPRGTGGRPTTSGVGGDAGGGGGGGGGSPRLMVRSHGSGGGGGSNNSSRPGTTTGHGHGYGTGTRRSLTLSLGATNTTLPDLANGGPHGATRPGRKSGVGGGGTGRRGGGGGGTYSGMPPRLAVPEPSPKVGPSGLVLYQVAAGGLGSHHLNNQ